MKTLRSSATTLFSGLAGKARRGLRYGWLRALGKEAGSAVYRFEAPTEHPPWPESWCLEARVDATLVGPEEAQKWARRQTLREMRTVGIDAGGSVSWSVTARASMKEAEPLFWYSPGPGNALPQVYPAFLESAVLLLAAESIDAVILGERLGLEEDQAPHEGPSTADPARLGTEDPQQRACTVFAARSWHLDGLQPRAKSTSMRSKLIFHAGKIEPDAAQATRSPNRRGSYCFSRGVGARVDLGIRDAGSLPRLESKDDPRPAVLVLVPFLARGGAEHTLFETLYALRKQFRFEFATLAPHRQELGDRRADFEHPWPRLFCLGDWVHPAAMPGILDSLLQASGASILYNANGSTLFYDFAPSLLERHPDLHILDHLYDHRVGYIERYSDPGLKQVVGTVVAENRRVAETLVQDYAWPADRAPVIWPCGRPAEEFPEKEEQLAVRSGLREELGYGKHDIVILTAARMHAQKRPLDLVQLAARVTDLEKVHFLVVGGGDLEGEMDAAIARHEPALRLRRLAFRTDIPHLIVASDVGCLVSDYEGLPVFLLECLQAGRPFLGTDVGELGYLIRATGAGWCIDEPGDLDALEAAVRQLAEPEARAARAARALEAGKSFSPESCARRYGQAFLGRDPGAPDY